MSRTFDDDMLDDKENALENNRFGGKMSRGARLLKEFKEVPMTPALDFLINTRKSKVAFDVEDDFRGMRETGATSSGLDKMRSSSGMRNMAPIVDQEAVDA